MFLTDVMQSWIWKMFVGCHQNQCRYRDRSILKSVLAPTVEILFFACPKKSTQKKRHPDSANILRFSLLARVFEGSSLALRKRAASLPLPYRAFSPKAVMLGAE
jgi:hypothetical protein